MLSLRPERVTVAPERVSGLENCLPGDVEFVSYLGGVIDIHVRLSGADRVIAQIPNRADGFVPLVGDRVYAGWTAEAASVFPGGGRGPAAREAEPDSVGRANP